MISDRTSVTDDVSPDQCRDVRPGIRGIGESWPQLGQRDRPQTLDRLRFSAGACHGLYTFSGVEHVMRIAADAGLTLPAVDGHAIGIEHRNEKKHPSRTGAKRVTFGHCWSAPNWAIRPTAVPFGIVRRRPAWRRRRWGEWDECCSGSPHRAAYKADSQR